MQLLPPIQWPRFGFQRQHHGGFRLLLVLSHALRVKQALFPGLARNSLLNRPFFRIFQAREGRCKADMGRQHQTCVITKRLKNSYYYYELCFCLSSATHVWHSMPHHALLLPKKEIKERLSSTRGYVV